jgi:hypothetical protein
MDQAFEQLTREQRRHLEDARQLWKVWSPLAKRREELAGAVAWKTVRDREYLTRYWHDGDTGEKKMTSLGPRSPATEKAKADFERERAEVDASLAALKPRLEGLGRVGRALRVGRLETPAADALREFWKADLLGSGVIVIGSSVVHLYEAAASVLLPRSILPEADLDLTVLDKLDLDLDDVLRILRRADKSFRRIADRTFCCREGFQIDVMPFDQVRSFYERLPGLEEHQLHVLDDVLRTPPVQEIAVARDGLPVPMAGLDPRSFAVLKYVRAEFDTRRNRNAAEIDREQAFAVGTIVQNYWRDEFEPEWLEAFPGLAEGTGAESPMRGPGFFR